MHRPFNAPKNYRNLALTLLGLLALLIVLEGWRYAIKPGRQYNSDLINAKLQKAADSFARQQQTLKQRSNELAQTLEGQLEAEQGRAELLASMEPYSDLWGVGLYISNQPVVWQGFSLGILEGVYIA